MQFVWHIPDFLSLEVACTIPFAYCLIYYAFKILVKINGNDGIIINTRYLDIKLASINFIQIFKSKCYILVTNKEESKEIEKFGFKNILLLDEPVKDGIEKIESNVIFNYHGIPIG